MLTSSPTVHRYVMVWPASAALVLLVTAPEGMRLTV